MANLFNTEKFNNDDDFANDAVSLQSWIGSFRDEDEMREVFLNLDRAMKYVHEHGYCVKTFNPGKIEILNHSTNQIKFEELLKIPYDLKIKDQIVKEDISRSALLQIGIYTKTLDNMNPAFVKESFDSFAQFLPEGDVPYYKGVIQRGASVYLCEYASEKRKRDLADLEKEFGSSTVDGGRQMIKSNGQSVIDDTNVNDSINDNIYRQINKSSDAAFISYLIYPTVILILLVVIALIALAFSYFS